MKTHSNQGRGKLRLLFFVIAIGGLLALFWSWRSSRSGEAPAGRLSQAQSTPAPDDATHQPKQPPQTPQVVADKKVAPTEPIAPRSKKRREDFDRRKAEHSTPTAAQQAALEDLRGRIPGLTVRFDPVTGSPDHIVATGRFLADSQSGGANPELEVRAFIDANPALFGLRSGVLDHARVTRNDVTAHNGMTTLVWNQELDGIPLYKTILQANVTKRGELIAIGNNFVPDPEAAASLPPAPRAALIAKPPVEAPKAISLAAANLGVQVPEDQPQPQTEAEGAERRQRYEVPRLSDTSAGLTWLPMSDTSMRLSWDVTLMSLELNSMFRIVVDAQTGEVLVRTSLTADISDATYRVFTTESPTPFSPGHETPSSLQPPLVNRVLLTTPALNTTASPNGWINDGQMETNGNNVDAHTDIDANNVADLPRPNGGAARLFDFSLDLTQVPSASKDASVTQLFYWCNFMHDRMYEMGFTESAGNFQVNNFGRGGAGNDPVQADAQDGSGTNNANFSTPSDGGSGRMQMFLWTGPTPDRDGSFEAEVVLHEYGHGVSNRLVGGGVGISALSSQGMGEGWSDFYGLALTAEASDNPHGNWARAGYSRYLTSGWLSENYYYGARRYSYSTDMLKNPHTFKDIDPTQVDWHTAVPRNPTYAATQDATQVHYQGTVWCVMLWDMRANLILKHGFAIGNDRAIRLVTDGLKLSPANPNFVQARDGIIQATLVSFPADFGEVWTAFAKRGMGQGATAPASSTTTGVVESYNVPDALQINDRSGWNIAGAKGGPFTPATKVLTLTNTSGSSASWSVNPNAAWLSANPSSGTLAAGANVTVTLSTQAAAVAPGFFSTNVVFTNTGTSFNQPIGVRLYVTPPRVQLFDLNSDPGWTRAGEWAFGTPTGAGGTVSGGVGNPDPTSGATGTNVFGVNLAGNHTTGITGPHYLTTGPINLSLHTTTRLRFQRWLNTNALANTRTAVEVSTNGTTWREVFVNPGTAITDNAWTKMEYDISSIADQQPTVYVRWSYQTISSPGAYSGWNIDDVELLGEPTSGITVTSANSATEGDAPLTATITLSPVSPTDLTVSLSSSGPDATVPASVVVPGGTGTATFPIAIVNDTLLDGTQATTITASGVGYASGMKVVQVQDDETATLTVSALATTTEGAGSVVGTVTVSAPPASAITVSLSSSDTTAAQVPPSAIIPAGQTSATFPISVIDDNKIDGTQNATITAHVANWTDGTADIAVRDNETLNLGVVLPTTVTEGGTGTGSATISGTLTADLVVSLASNNTARLTIPATVTIPAGSISANFTLTAPNNALTDGTATVTITASTASFNNGTAITNVLDNDLHHFSIATIASPQTRAAPFSVTITAKDVNDVTMASYTGTPTLSAAGTAGPVTVSPTTVSGFVSGVRTLNVTASTFSTNVTLTVNGGAGHTGTSNAFDVTSGPLHHFVWSTVASPQTAGTPFSATITAQDAGNNTASGFTGTAALNCGQATKVVGTGTASSTVLPLYTFYHDQRSQCIYLQSEIGAAGTIKGLTLNVTTLPGQTMNNWTIRMKHTALASYASAAWESTGWTTVYQANETISATGLVTFTFATPFAYDGVSNLMVDFSFNNSSFTSAGAVVFTTASPVRSIYYFTDSVYGDPLTWSGTTNPAPLTSTVMPNLQLQMDRTTVISPTVTGNFTSGAWTGPIEVLQSAVAVALRADDGASHTGDSNTFNVTGSANPEISVEQPALNVLADGAATVDFGVAGVGSDPATKTFVIRNVGNQVLTISGITGDGPDLASFTFPSLAGVAIQPAGSFSFTAQFTAASAGSKTAAIHIGSNDTDETPFDITLTGSGAVAPEMKVEQPSGTERADGSGTLAFGDSVLGVPVVKTLTIRNTGGVALHLGAITIDGAHGADFAAGTPGTATIATGGSTTLDVTFSATSTGGRSALLHIVSNDPNENPYDIMLTGIGSAPAGSLRLARDINQLPTGPGVTAANAAVMGSVVYFAANTGDTGIELWKSDGTAAGTSLVKDILTGIGSSSPANFVVIGSTLYFSANNSTNGIELWKSDGTTAGTVLVKDIFSGTSSSSPANLTNVAGTLYFSATDSTANGIELWKSDGTAAGTVLVLNINTTANTSSSPANLTAVGSRLFFTANDGVSGVELWTSDGSAAGTVLVTDIILGITTSSPANLVAVGNTLFFSATDGTNGIELWKSDGAVPAAVLVKDINAGSASSSPAVLVNAGGTLFFRATTAANGVELWKSDGSAAGTVLVKDILAGTPSSTPSSLVAVGAGIYFAATDGTNGIELWKSDGTTAGTVLVANINPGASSSSPANLTLIGGTLYFSATTATGGAELWKSDGTAATTMLVEDINPGTGGSAPAVMFNVGGLLVFLASDGVNGSEMWVSDGTAAGTNLIEDITPGSSSAAPANLRVLNGAVLFNANDSVNGAELWRSDGLPGGTSLLKDIAAGATSSSPGAGVVIGSTLYFPAFDSAGGTELWQTDGTLAGTVRVKDIFSGTTSSVPINLTRVGNTLYFAASDSTANGTELWKSDGTSAGTVLVANINPIANASSSPANLVDFNGTLFFTANDGTNGVELWKSDGSTASLVKDINPGSNVSSSPANFRVVGSTLYFTATTVAEGNELWKTDGTPGGTVIVADISAGTGSSSPANLTTLGSTLYFAATNSANGRELWKTDGSAAGAVVAADIFPGVNSSSPNNITLVGSTMFFAAFTSANGTELWKSDGTAAGTVMVADIGTGTASSFPSSLTNVYGTLYFSGTTAANGAELWKSDGTAAGTMLAADIRPGTASSSPANLTATGDRLFFTATGPDLGTELWTLEIESPDISIEQPANTTLIDGESTVTFPQAVVANGGAQSLTFTIRNTAINAPLTGFTFNVDGAAGGEYVASGLSAATVNGASTATFIVTFTPTTTGTRTAVLHVGSNDPDESPFDITITGTGVAPSPLETWRLANFGTLANSGNAANTADPDHDGVQNYFEWASGTNPNTRDGDPIEVVAGVIVRRGGPTTFVIGSGASAQYFALFGRRKDYVAAGLTYTVKFSADLENWVTSDANATPTVIADDGEIEAITLAAPATVNGQPTGFIELNVVGP